MSKNNIKIGSNKNFGIVFFIFFLIVSIFPLFKNGEIRVWSLIVGIIFLILGLTNSKILTPLNIIWFKIGIFLGSFFSCSYTNFFNYEVIRKRCIKNQKE